MTCRYCNESQCDCQEIANDLLKVDFAFLELKAIASLMHENPTMLEILENI